MAGRAGGVSQDLLEDSEEAGLEEHADHLTLEADPVQHLESTVVRVGRVGLVLAQQRDVGMYDTRAHKPTETRKELVLYTAM